MGTRSFPGVKYSRGVLLTTHLLLVPWSWKSRAIPVPTLWATTGPVTGTLYLYEYLKGHGKVKAVHAVNSMQTLPNLCSLRLKQFHKRYKKIEIKILNCGLNFCLWKWRHGTRGGRRILLVDNMAFVWSCCGRSGSSMLQFGFQLDFLVHTHVIDHTIIQFQFVLDLL